MILRRHELQKLVEIHHGYKRGIDAANVSERAENEEWKHRDTSAAFRNLKKPKDILPITLDIPPYYSKVRHRRSLGILLICNGLSGVEVNSLLHVDPATVSRWRKKDSPVNKAAFFIAQKLIAGIQKAKNFSDEDIQNDLRIDAVTLNTYKKEDEYKYALNAWRSDPNVAAVGASVHFKTPQNTQRSGT